MTNGNHSVAPMLIAVGDGGSETDKRMETPLTKREYFAGLAMQGLLADAESQPENSGYKHARKEFTRAMADTSVEYADALIAALNEDEGGR